MSYSRDRIRKGLNGRREVLRGYLGGWSEPKYGEEVPTQRIAAVTMGSWLHKGDTGPIVNILWISGVRFLGI